MQYNPTELDIIPSEPYEFKIIQTQKPTKNNSTQNIQTSENFNHTPTRTKMGA